MTEAAVREFVQGDSFSIKTPADAVAAVQLALDSVAGRIPWWPAPPLLPIADLSKHERDPEAVLEWYEGPPVVCIWRPELHCTDLQPPRPAVRSPRLDRPRPPLGQEMTDRQPLPIYTVAMPPTFFLDSGFVQRAIAAGALEVQEQVNRVESHVVAVRERFWSLYHRARPRRTRRSKGWRRHVRRMKAARAV